MWKNVVERSGPQMPVQYGAEKMRFAWRVTKARIQTYTHDI